MKDYNNTFGKNTTLSEKIEKATATYSDSDENGCVELKNKDFLQTSILFQEELVELSLTEPVASAIFSLMAFRMENNNTYIIKQTTLAEALHKNVKTIEKAIRILKERDFLTTFKQDRLNVYFINPRIYCKVSASYKQRLIEEYSRINQDTKAYFSQHENISYDVIINAEKEHLIYKKDFSKTQEGKRLMRPNNYSIHRMNEMKKVLDNLDESDYQFLKKKYINEETPTDKELEKWEKSNKLMEQRQAIIDKELEQKILQKELEYKRDEIEEQGFGMMPPDDPFGIFQDIEEGL